VSFPISLLTLPGGQLSADVAGDRQATTTFNLPAGAYVVEARATFEAQ
jgi:hypothetical protein